jgi:hypothetical protein
MFFIKESFVKIFANQNDFTVNGYIGTNMIRDTIKD